ncbi:unnamed protein product [Trichobilharzia regenti]|nr:unnamed protein product [Trichobilharzia regenti]
MVIYHRLHHLQLVFIVEVFHQRLDHVDLVLEGIFPKYEMCVCFTNCVCLFFIHSSMFEREETGR